MQKKNSTLRPVLRVPMVDDGPLLNIENAAAVILRNAGTATVNLNSGMYTLDSKETLSLNVTEDYSELDVQNITVTFDTSTGATKKLQVLILKANPC
jgi:hypothetical protein